LATVTGNGGVSTEPNLGKSFGLVTSISSPLECLLVRPVTKFQRNIMVVIRLARGGSKKRPFYNIVVANSRQRRDGRFIERVGFYNPIASGAAEKLRVAQDRVSYWVGVGAQLSPTVQRLVDDAQKAAA
jgi:small subunit ribosomal protein S16